MNRPQWLKQLLITCESCCLDNATDRERVARAIEAGIQHEREEVVNKIVTWLGKAYPRELGTAAAKWAFNVATKISQGDY